jgi:hypothetical protein
MRKFIFVLIVILILLAVNTTFADIDEGHCYDFDVYQKWKCEQGVDVWLSKSNYRPGVNYFCGTGEIHWDEFYEPDCDDWPSRTFPAEDFSDAVRKAFSKCPARDCVDGKAAIFADWHTDTYTTLKDDEAGFRYAYPKTCWVNSDQDFQLSRKLFVGANGNDDPDKYWVAKCAVAVGPEVISIDGQAVPGKRFDYKIKNSHSWNDDHEAICSSKDINDPPNDVSDTSQITINLPQGKETKLSSDVTVARSRMDVNKQDIKWRPKGREDVWSLCENKVLPVSGEKEYRSQTFILDLEIKTCPKASDPNKKYATPDGSDCTRCIVDSDCGSNVCDYKNDHSEIYSCDRTSDDDPDNGATYQNNVCKRDIHKIENDPIGCIYACGDHWSPPGEDSIFGGYTQNDIDSKTSKCCGNNFRSFLGNTPSDPEESFNMRKCVGCEQDPNDQACCDLQTDCVYNGICYDQLSFVFEQDFQAVCAGGIWLGTKPKLLYGKTTYTDLPMCGDLICDLLSGEDCWSCPTDCSLGKEFSPDEPENIQQAENKLNTFLCNKLQIIDCAQIYQNISESISCMAMCDTNFKSIFGYAKKLKDTQLCRNDCECVSNNCVSSSPDTDVKYCCPFGYHFDDGECVQNPKITIGE